MDIKFTETSDKGTILSPKDFLSMISRNRSLREKYPDQPKSYKKNGIRYIPVYINFYGVADIKGINCSTKRASLLLSGVDSRGSRVCIIKPDIKPFVVVKVTDDYISDKLVDYERFVKYLTGITSNYQGYPTSLTHEKMMLYDYHCFQIDKSPYVKVFFNTIAARSSAIKAFANERLTRGEDDYDYVPLYLRHNLDTPIDRWTFIPVDTAEYTGDYFREKVYSKVFLVSSDHKFTSIPEFIHKDLSLTNAWDIETKKFGKDMTLPKPGQNYYISAISSTISTHFDYDPLISVVFTVINVTPKTINVPGKITPLIVCCKDECELLMTYYKYIEIFRPEFEHAFNGGSFDYPIMKDRVDYWTLCKMISRKKYQFSINLNEDAKKKDLTVFDQFMRAYCHTREPIPVNFSNMRASKNVVTEEIINNETKRYYKNVSVKLEATRNINVLLPKFFGSVHFDTQPLLIKAYPSIELKKLESYLLNAKLGTKEDMNYVDMHNITALTEVIDESNEMVIENVVSDDESEYQKNMVCKFLYYSYIDSLKLHWLLHKESFIMSKRALAALGRFPVSDTYFRADGAVLMNMIASQAFKFHRCVSVLTKDPSEDDLDNEEETEESFSGAYVVSPKIGLHTDRPVTGIDFSSLYPSLMATFNLSPDMVVRGDDVEYFKKLGYTILSLEIPYNICKKGKKKDKNGILRTEICKAHFIQHNGIVDQTTDKKTIVKYQKNMKWTKGDTTLIEFSNVEMKDTLARHTEATKALNSLGINPKDCEYTWSLVKITGRDGLKNEQMGVNAKLGQELLDRRNQIKKPFGKVKTAIELLESQGKHECQWDYEKFEIVKEGGTKVTIDDLKYLFRVLNSEQLAVKIMANTIYGKSGQIILFIYSLAVAAGITYTGQNMATKPMIGLVENVMKCEVMYGDTDSLYIKCPWYIYEDIIKEYRELRYQAFGIPHDVSVNIHEKTLSDEEVKLKISKLWEPMVHRTREYIALVTEIVADTLCSMNNTRYLQMSYEEVGFPTYLAGKKKYALVAHEKYINFFPESVFMRGFDFKKRGQTPIAKKIGNAFLKKIFHPGFDGNTIGLLKQTLIEFSNSDCLDDFVIFRSFQPDKKSVEINTIVDYMSSKHYHYVQKEDYVSAELYTPPIPGESFPYIYVERQRGYTIDGKVEKVHKAAELAEPYKVVSTLKGCYKINLYKYLEKMKGSLGRFIIAESIFDQFEPERDDEQIGKYYQRIKIYNIDPPEYGETTTSYYDRIKKVISGIPPPRFEDPDAYYKRVDSARSNASHKYILRLFKAMTEGFKDFDSNRKLAAKSIRQINKGNVELFEILKNIVFNIINNRYTPESLMAVYYAVEELTHDKEIKYPIWSELPNGIKSTNADIGNYYNEKEELIKRRVLIVMNMFIERINDKKIPITMAEDIASDISRGALLIFMGCPYLKNDNYDLMYSLTLVLDLIKGAVFIRKEYQVCVSQKQELKVLVTKKEKQSSVEKILNKKNVHFEVSYSNEHLDFINNYVKNGISTHNK